MIAYLRGTVLDKSDTALVIEAGGVGRTVEMARSYFADLDLGDEVSVHTVTVVRPESITIYGFPTPEDRAVFDVLRGVNGIGPRSALAALGTLGIEAIAGAIELDDDSPLRKVPGIGPKTARMVVMSLRGKLTAYAPANLKTPVVAQPAPDPTASATRSETLAALTALGWAKRAADEALDIVLSGGEADAAASVPALLRAALAELGPRR